MADPYRLLQRFMSADETIANKGQSNTPFIYLFIYLFIYIFYLFFFLLLFFIYFFLIILQCDDVCMTSIFLGCDARVLYIDRDCIQIDCCSYEKATEDNQADSI